MIGLAHLFLIWPGDVLAIYAVRAGVPAAVALAAKAGGCRDADRRGVRAAAPAQDAAGPLEWLWRWATWGAPPGPAARGVRR
ncbi:hypothetical protein GCM10009850_074640 [Nonomuraea monospora]|uniref:Uncharacterized protein n=1 Tax=Nonomuraea monospora TaxID=568818 RepID=A0ABN3CRL7_9ACTN